MAHAQYRLSARGTRLAPISPEEAGQAKRGEIAESVITGRKSGADMARLYDVSHPTVSRIVAQHRSSNTGPRA